MPATHRVKVAVDQSLLNLAGEALGISGTDVSDVIRAALAKAAGVNVEKYTPRVGRPRKERDDCDRRAA